LGGLAMLVLSAALVTPRVATGTHSLPSTPEFWDCNFDHVSDDTCVKGYKAGNSWTPALSARFDDAFGEWRTNTQFDPKVDTSGQPVYRDRQATCVPDWTPGGFIILAAVCRVHQWDGIGEWWRITATPTYFNHQLIFSGLTWETSANAPGPNEIHFGGTLVHELGHWIRLVDLDCAAGATMCNASMSEQDTFDQFSLTQDDIDGANFNY
jgi:hypothetical protein